MKCPNNCVIKFPVSQTWSGRQSSKTPVRVLVLWAMESLITAAIGICMVIATVIACIMLLACC